MADQVGGTEWLRAQRAVVCPPAQDAVARVRMQMTHRIRPVLERLPPMLGTTPPPPTFPQPNPPMI